MKLPRVPNSERTCTKPGCTSPVWAKDFCHRHYRLDYTRRWRERKGLVSRTHPIPEDFSEILHSRRSACGLTVKTIARLAGVTPRALQSYEAREAKPPKVVFEKLLTSLDQFLNSTGPQLIAKWVNNARKEPLMPYEPNPAKPTKPNTCFMCDAPQGRIVRGNAGFSICEQCVKDAAAALGLTAPAPAAPVPLGGSGFARTALRKETGRCP